MRTDIRQCSTLDDVNRELKKVQKSLSDLPVFMGYGSPENVVVAKVGSLYLNLDGGANTTLWVKESGSLVSSGWIAK